jgi:hypothetical protein
MGIRITNPHLFLAFFTTPIVIQILQHEIMKIIVIHVII